MSASQSGLNFDFEWRLTLFAAVLVPVMIGLGFWQLQRSDEKMALAAAFEQRQLQPPAFLYELGDKPAGSLAYMPVRLRGEFLQGEYFLLDNRVREGQVGYEVLSILKQAGGGGAVLVNRGWIAGTADRLLLPVVPAVAGEIELTGHIYVAPGEPYLLAEQQLGEGWPKRIQAVEMDKLGPPVEALMSGEVFPYPVRIDGNQVGALRADWQIVNISPSKHTGYAVQWFSMAAVLFVIYLLRSTNLWQLIKGSGRAGE